MLAFLGLTSNNGFNMHCVEVGLGKICWTNLSFPLTSLSSAVVISLYRIFILL